jgi:hypothetical protein
MRHLDHLYNVNIIKMLIVSALENVDKRKGLASSLVIVCDICSEEHAFVTSKQITSGHEINLRFVYGMHCIGKGSEASRTVCATFNEPNPPTNFHNISKLISQSVEVMTEECMQSAVKDAVEENGSSKNIAFAVDETW